jgi:pimeloyl-ACP methyl ester carboxylesterase
MSFFGFGKSESASSDDFTDTTLRSIINPAGPEDFKQYEHALYICAQLSRIVYCDTGIMWNVLKHLGRSNDVVNKIISAYDKEFASKRRVPVTSQAGDGAGRPMESYSLTVASGNQPHYGTYISTPGDLTLLIIKATEVRENPNSIFKPTDLFISFKGSSTMENFKHDLMSQFTPADLATLVKEIGLTTSPGNTVTGAFIRPILMGWKAIIAALEAHAPQPGTRLFLTGHSLGGAYTTLFALILAEARSQIPVLKNVESIHVVSFGAPTVVGDKARNTFNAHLDSEFLTLDRVVSQKVAARSAATQGLVGGIAGPNDVIPTVPVGFSHPGFRPLATEIGPEAGGRPYSMDNIRKSSGVESTTRYRDAQTWPFEDAMNLGDRAHAAELAEIVKGLTGVTPPTEVEDAAAKAALEKEAAAAPAPAASEPEDPSGPPAQGGALFQPEKTKYEQATKTHIPNFISVQGSVYAYGFAHAEYLGMFFLGAFRLAGMKNPAKTSIAVFKLYDDGVKITYVPIQAGGRRKTRKGSKGRKVRKGRKLTRRRY